jgi:type III pantothenate kinase
LNLYADIGNSGIRLMQDGSARVIAGRYTAATLADIFGHHLRELARPDRVVAACVAGAEVEKIFTGLCLAAWSIRPEFIHTGGSLCGVSNAYPSPSQLGVDRWLAMVAAWNKYRTDLCIFDCGTAVTADIIGADGRHAGGYILPGRFLMQDSLARGTARITLSGEYAYTGMPGRSTPECVYNGITLGICAFVERIAGPLQGDGGKCVITGGGAGEIIPLLSMPAIHEPWLVLEGIRLAAGQ